MARSVHLLRFGALVTAVAAFAGTAAAAGTTAGTTVSNTFTLDYAVGGNAQPQINNSGTPTLFTVDRKVDLTITPLDPTQTVFPNSVDNTTRFRLTNLSNDDMAYSFVVATTGSTYTPANVSVRYFIDLDNDGVLDVGETMVNYTAGSASIDIAPDQNVVIIVESDVPSGTADGTSATFTLTADSLYPATSIDTTCTLATCPPGTAIVGDSNGNDLTNAAENVLADGAGSTDAANQGDFSAAAVMNVQAPTLTAVKSVAVFSTTSASDAACAALTGPVAGNQYSAPGACVQYSIAVTNTGSGTAQAINVADFLPAQVRYVAASLTTSSGSGFQNDPGIAGTGPTLTKPAAAENCDGSTNCFINLTDAILAGGQNGQVRIWAIVR